MTRAPLRIRLCHSLAGTTNMNAFKLAQMLVFSIVLSSAVQAHAIMIEPQVLPPSVRVEVGKAKQMIELKSLDIRSEIVSGLARTRVEMVFFNPNNSVLEGELQFPLLAGQEIDGFALDINGELRAAVPVEKAKGKEVFEEVIRRRVDPALLETTTGENFRLRIYPLPAKGTRRVVVHYSEALQVSKGHYRYRLALAHAQALPQFSLEVLVAAPAGAPSAVLPGDTTLTLSPAGTWYRGTIQRDDFSARGWLEVAIPDGSAKAQLAVANVQSWQGESYIQIDTPIKVRQSPRKIPSHVGIVWDSSMSGRLRDHAAEFALLDAYFKALGNGQVSLIRVRDVAETAQVFKIVKGDWSALKRVLQETISDGATDLNAWQFAASVKEVLLFSDGLANYGSSLTAPFPAERDLRIYPIVAAASANRGLMRQYAHNAVAGRSGVLIDLLGDRQMAIDALLQQRTTVSSINAAGDADLILDQQALTRGRLRITGKFRGELPTRIDVRLQEPRGSQQVISVPLFSSAETTVSADEIPLVARQWARMKIARLSSESERHRAEIGRLGQAFNLLTAETSLIVLDEVSDYVDNNIIPPAALRAQYDQLMAEKVREKRNRLSRHLEQVVVQYQNKIEWWQRDFPKTPKEPAPKKYTGSQDVASQRAASAGYAAPSAESVDVMLMVEEENVMEVATSSANKSAELASSKIASEIKIGLKKWTADAPYLARLRKASDADLYAVYLDQRADWINSSAYYLDAADELIERKQIELGLRVLSNLAEMDLENRAILRILGYRLLQAGQPALAVPIFEQVRDLAPFEPQSFRDLGLAYADIGELQKAADALYEVAKGEWDGRFAEVGLIALTELNALIATHPNKIDTSRFDQRLLRNLPVDLRVVLNWDADNTDMDLWVTDPNGERAYYGNRLTHQGGRMSNDLTAGYGPEEFMLKQAIPGTYTVEANYYGSQQQLISGSVTLRLALITDFGKPAAKQQSVILRLEEKQQTVLVGEFEVSP